MSRQDFRTVVPPVVSTVFIVILTVFCSQVASGIVL